MSSRGVRQRIVMKAGLTNLDTMDMCHVFDVGNCDTKSTVQGIVVSCASSDETDRSHGPEDVVGTPIFQEQDLEGDPHAHSGRVEVEVGG